MSAHKELIARLEGLEGPCRECNAEIHLVLNPCDEITIHRYEDNNEIAFMEVEFPNGETELDEILSYTASIDAALTLIPEGLYVDQMGEWGKGFMREKGRFYCIIGPTPDRMKANPYRCQFSNSLPIAICIAALKAMEAQS